MLRLPPPSGWRRSRRPDESSGEIQVFIENDFLAGTDRYYSNGLKIGFGAQKEALAQAGAALAGVGLPLSWRGQGIRAGLLPRPEYLHPTRYPHQRGATERPSLGRVALCRLGAATPGHHDTTVPKLDTLELKRWRHRPTRTGQGGPDRVAQADRRPRAARLVEPAAHRTGVHAGLPEEDGKLAATSRSTSSPRRRHRRHRA